MDLRRLIAVSAAALIFQVPALAGEIREQPRAVLELFTSQGCSSCPPADAMLKDLGQQSDLITLAYHVDYWDYIGWADTFGAKANSDLQRSYAQSWGSARIYTPQLIVNGASGVVGSRQKDVAGAVGAARLALPVTLQLADEMLKISIPGDPGLKEAMVVLVTFKDRAQVVITRGENAGKTMDYTQIVTGRQVLGMWEPEGGAHFKLPLGQLLGELSNGAVVLVQEEAHGLPGAIIGASQVQL